MKMDLKSLYYVAVNCKNEEEAAKLVKTLAEAGFEWGNVTYHKEHLDGKTTFWSDKNGGTCYIFDEGTLWTGTLAYCREELIDIFTYDEAEFKFF